MLTSSKITEIYFIIDEFIKEFEKAKSGRILDQNVTIKRRNRLFTLTDSEIMTILVLFHYGQFRNLKHFYLNYVVKHMQNEFPKTVSYNRFVELQKRVTVPMAIFLKTAALGKQDRCKVFLGLNICFTVN